MRREEVRSFIVRGLASYRPDALGGDPSALCDALVGMDSLIHLAYTPPDAKGYWDQQALEVKRNVIPTLGLLKAAEQSEVGFMAFASSVSVYAPPARGVEEDGSVGFAATPYATVKLEQERAIRSWAERTGSRAAILRLATVYGPGETVSRAIPNFIRAVLAGRPPVVDGVGAEPFDPIFVGDVAEAFIAATERRADGVFNIGTGCGRTSREIAEIVLQLCESDLGVVGNPETVERCGVVCNVSLAADGLGFRAVTPFEAGLRAEIAWLRAVQEAGWRRPATLTSRSRRP